MRKKSADLDVIIAGGGPGGLSALLWCRELGLDAILLEKEVEFGGQLCRTYNPIKNYLGINAVNGRELRDKFLRPIETEDKDHFTGTEIIAADLPNKTVNLADGRKVAAKAIIIATGVRPNELDVPGEAEFKGRGILESGVKAINEVRGKRVVLVGGGDAAVENALILAEHASRVIVVHRGAKFTARDEFLDAAHRSETIEILKGAVVKAIIGKKMVEYVDLEHPSTGEHTRVQADALLIKIGVRPNTELIRGQVGLDDRGYVIIDSDCAASLPGVFAVGDAANGTAPTISSAVGQGATAAKAIVKLLNS